MILSNAMELVALIISHSVTKPQSVYTTSQSTPPQHSGDTSGLDITTVNSNLKYTEHGYLNIH